MSRNLIREFNVIIKDIRYVDVLFGYCYPSTYRAGMTGLATHLFYSILNTRTDTSCERYFRYDTRSPAESVESGRPLADNHILGFSLSWEEDILNVLQMLESGKIPVLSKMRINDDPIVIMGGPVVTANPEPYTSFVDAFVIGEGDLVVHEIIEVVKNSDSRTHAVEGLAEIEGVYVPSTEPSFVKRLTMKDLDQVFHPTAQISPDVKKDSRLQPVFGKALLLEVARGCGHSCAFCLVGHLCRPRRVRSLIELKKIVEAGINETPVDKVALIASSLGDMDNTEALVDWIVSKQLLLSIPSIRADAVTEDLLRSLVKGGQRTLTIAPESGSSDLRKSMGKGLSDEQIDKAVRLAAEAEVNSLKLYFIIGLPGEEDEDIMALVEMVRRYAKETGLRVVASVNPFVPKAQTRWERFPQPILSTIRRKLRTIRKGLHNIPRANVEFYDPRSARIQASLSIGDRSLGSVIRLAAKYGGLGGWRRAEKEAGIEFFSIANDEDRLGSSLPWDFLRKNA